MKKFVYILLLTLNLGACVGTTPIKPEQKSNIHKATLISLLGDELTFTKVGFTVFNNDYFVRDSSTWHIDADVRSVLTESLKKSSPDITIVDIPFNHVELLKIYKSPDSWGEYANIGRIEPELKKQLAAMPVDVVFLVHKQRGEDAIGMTSVFLNGYGIYYRSLPFVDATLKPYVYFSVLALDGKTLKPLTSKYVRGISTDFGKTKISWDDQIKTNLSEQLLSDFESSIKNVVKSHLQIGLHEMGF